MALDVQVRFRGSANNVQVRIHIWTVLLIQHQLLQQKMQCLLPSSAQRRVAGDLSRIGSRADRPGSTGAQTAGVVVWRNSCRFGRHYRLLKVPEAVTKFSRMILLLAISKADSLNTRSVGQRCCCGAVVILQASQTGSCYLYNSKFQRDRCQLITVRSGRSHRCNIHLIIVPTVASCSAFAENNMHW